MASSIALVRAEVDREIARMARLGQIMDERSALTRTLAEEARARLASEKLAEESEQTPAAPPGQHEDIMEEGNATETLWLSEPVPVRQVLAQGPPDEASVALRAHATASSPERVRPPAVADLDGWDSPHVPLPPWPSQSGLHSPSVPVRGAAVGTDASALAQGRRSGAELGHYRVLRTCRVRKAAALSSQVCGTLEPGRVIEVLARRTLTVSPAAQRKSARRRGGGGVRGANGATSSSTAAASAAERREQQPAKVVRLQFCGGWVSECTASRGLRSLEKLDDTLSTTQPRRQAGVGRHIAERKEASFYCYGVHHKDKQDKQDKQDSSRDQDRQEKGTRSPRPTSYLRPSTPLSPAQARRLGMHVTPTYTLAQLQAGAWRSLHRLQHSYSSTGGGSDSRSPPRLDPQRLEMALSNDAFESAFGMDKASFGRLPSFERERRKKILLLTAKS